MKQLKVLGIVALCALIAPAAFCQFLGNPDVGPADVGLEVLVPDTVAFPDVDSAGNNANWEAYCDALGDGTLCFTANSFAEGTSDANTERPIAVFIRPDLSVQMEAGWYDDAGNPITGNCDNVRADGNPPQIGGLRTAGATKYCIGSESTPWQASGVSGSRWVSNYLDHMYCVQILDLTANGPVPVSNVIDPFYGWTATGGVGKGRAGGAAGLSNGNFVVEVEDRSGLSSQFTKTSVLTILNGNDGSKVLGPFTSAPADDYNGDGWDGLTSYDGGFSIRINGSPRIIFRDNDGNVTGEWAQVSYDFGYEDTQPDPHFDPSLPNPEGYTTSITTGGRGDGNHTAASITGHHVYYAGTGADIDLANTGVYITKIDVTTQQTVADAQVNDALIDESGASLIVPHRVSCFVGPNEAVIVTWSDSSNNEEEQCLARVYNSDLEPQTDVFFPFSNHEVGTEHDPTEETIGMMTKHTQCAISPVGILITSRAGTIPTEPGGMYDIPDNSHLFTVLSNPLAAVPVSDWSVY